MCVFYLQEKINKKTIQLQIVNKNIFDNLFVLELANNHWGDLERGKEIVRQFAKVVKENNVRAAIKLQFRDTDNFIHKDFKGVGQGEDLTALCIKLS